MVSLVEMHYAEGNDLSRFVDFGAATAATPGVCGSGELSGAASEHCRQDRKRKSAADWNGNWSRQEVKRRHVLSGRRTKTLRVYWMAVNPINLFISLSSRVIKLFQRIGRFIFHINPPPLRHDCRRADGTNAELSLAVSGRNRIEAKSISGDVTIR